MRIPGVTGSDEEGEDPSRSRTSESAKASAKNKLDDVVGSIKSVKKPKGLDPKYSKIRASAVERSHDLSVLGWSIIVVLVTSLVLLLVVVIIDDVWTLGDYINNIFCNNIALIIVILFLDTIVNSNKESRLKRNEARKILRYNRLIQPDIDLYLVRKNMVVTPNGKTVRKFQVDSRFTISDMRDMYSPSELVADVGISKIKRFGHFQENLRHDFSKLVENVDFVYYPEIAEAVMKYLNATSYGAAALEAVIGYEDARSGTKSMRVMVSGMIRDEPDNGSFMQANPTMKNVYLVHQMINEQEKAVSDYLRLIKTLEDADPAERRKRSRTLDDEDYE